MSKNKKMKKIDLNDFFKSSGESEDFKVFSEDDIKYSNQEEPEIKKNGQKLTVRKEKKGRGGKTVTVIEGYVGNPQVLDDLCRKMKQHCGVGGSTKGKTIILQGDICDKAVKFLLNSGYNAKKTTM